jgi:hypothetical protein
MSTCGSIASRLFCGSTVRIVPEHAHADGARELRDAAADVADSDDAESLAAELGVAHALPRAPVALAGRLVDREGPLDAGEHQHQGVLGHRLRVRAGRVNDRDPPARGRRDVERVEADTVAADDLQVRAGGHQTVGTARLGAEQDAVSLRGDLDERLLGLLVAQDHVHLALELCATVLVGGSGEDDDLAGLSHAGSSPFVGGRILHAGAREILRRLVVGRIVFTPSRPSCGSEVVSPRAFLEGGARDAYRQLLENDDLGVGDPLGDMLRRAEGVMASQEGDNCRRSVIPYVEASGSARRCRSQATGAPGT